MKAALFLVLFSLSLVLAQPGGSPLASWAGSTIGVNTTWLQPSVGATTCTNGTSNYTYAAFSFTPSTTGIRQVIALGTGFNVFVLNSTLTANPCVNVVAELTANNQAVEFYGPLVEDSFVFQANVTYWFVVSTTNPADFALAVYNVLASGNNAGAATWSPVYFTSPTACTQAGGSVPFAKFSWVQNATGLFDVTAGFALNTTATWGSDTYIALFNANVTNAVLASTTLCSPINPNLVSAVQEYQSRAGHLFGVQLVTGQTYTVVASGSAAGNYANYGFNVAQSRISPAVFLPGGFIQPQLDEASCNPSTIYTNSSFAALSALSGGNSYKVVYSVAELSTSVYSNWTTSTDSAAFVYQGINVGTNSTAPLTCPTASASFVAGASSFPASVNIAPSTQYSFVSSFQGGAEVSGQGEINAFLVYVLTGAPAGNVNTSTGGVSTTGTGSGGATNGGGVASGSHGTTGNFSSTTNAGSSVVCSIVFVVLAILALLF